MFDIDRRTICDGDFGRAPHCVNVLVPRPNSTDSHQGEVFKIWQRTWFEERHIHNLWRRTFAESCRAKQVVDIGASVGPYALYFASRGCGVLAVEPDWRLAHLMRLAAREQKLWLTISHTVISPTPRLNATLRWGHTDWSASHTVTSLARVPRPVSSTWSRVVVPTLSLDDLLERFSSVHLLKVEVSGSEFSVLCSGRHMLSAGRAKALLLTVDYHIISSSHGRLLRLQVEASGFRVAPSYRSISSWNWSSFFACFSGAHFVYGKDAILCDRVHCPVDANLVEL